MTKKNRDSKAYCLPTAHDTCDPRGIVLRSQALDASHVATGTFIGGGITALVGLIVFLTARPVPSRPSATVSVVPVIGSEAAAIHAQGVW
jgi:hypothetical protein